MNIWIKRSGLTILLFLTAYLTGCATASRPEGMTVNDYQDPTPLADSVSVNVVGGQETSSMGKSQISDEDFATAISQSILDTGVFTQVLEGDTGQCLLTVAIMGMDQPSFGFDFTVKMEAAWRLTDKASGNTVWEQVIKSEHTATTGDAFAAVERLRLANEGAAKANIKQAMVVMGEITL